MPRRLIDLSLEITDANAWVQFPRRFTAGTDEPPTKIETIMDRRKQGYSFCQRIETTTQSFTHYDAPCHFDLNGLTNEQVPLEQLVNEAAVIDMSHKGAGDEVIASDLEASGADVRPGDTALIRTGWTDKHWGTETFWADMICMSRDACDWLIEKKIVAIASDFYLDTRPLERDPSTGVLRKRERPARMNHHEFLERGIILIEWLTNLGAIQKPRVELVCLPLKIKGSDGAPARVVAIETD